MNASSGVYLRGDESNQLNTYTSLSKNHKQTHADHQMSLNTQENHYSGAKIQYSNVPRGSGPLPPHTPLGGWLGSENHKKCTYIKSLKSFLFGSAILITLLLIVVAYNTNCNG